MERIKLSRKALHEEKETEEDFLRVSYCYNTGTKGKVYDALQNHRTFSVRED